MLGRFGRRRPEAPLEELTRERSETAPSTTALVSLLQAVEVQVDDGGDVERKELADQQTSDYCESERVARVGAFAGLPLTAAFVTAGFAFALAKLGSSRTLQSTSRARLLGHDVGK